jgi:hypothetical protein
MTYTTAASTIDSNLDRVYDAWTAQFGIGPCGAYAAMRREDGWGDIAVCQAHETSDDLGFTHYVILQGNAIIDLANPLGDDLEYTEIERLDAGEMPECIGQAEVDWLRLAMTGAAAGF